MRTFQYFGISDEYNSSIKMSIFNFAINILILT